MQGPFTEGYVGVYRGMKQKMETTSVERFRSKEPQDIGLQNPRSTEHCKTYSCVIYVEGPGDPQTIQKIL